MSAKTHDETRRPRWLDRRRLYTGGALMVLAPFGVAGCDPEAGPQDAVAPDVHADPGAVDPGAILIAPPFDAWDATRDIVAIASCDPCAGDAGNHDAPIAIDAWDLGTADPGPADPGPADPGPDDPGPDDPGGPIFIAPFDTGPSDDGGPIAIAPPQGARGFLEPCQSDLDCYQQYNCEVAMMCILPAPGCGEAACLPRACEAPADCGAGRACAPVAPGEGVCIRFPGQVPGGIGSPCASDADCVGDAFCRDACIVGGMMCVVPAMQCLPAPCTDAQPTCPPDAECRTFADWMPATPGAPAVGLGDGFCVKK